MINPSDHMTVFGVHTAPDGAVRGIHQSSFPQRSARSACTLRRNASLYELQFPFPQHVILQPAHVEITASGEGFQAKQLITRGGHVLSSRS